MCACVYNGRLYDDGWLESLIEKKNFDIFWESNDRSAPVPENRISCELEKKSTA